MQRLPLAGLIISGGTRDYNSTRKDVEVFPEMRNCIVPSFPDKSPPSLGGGREGHTLSVIGDTLVACGGWEENAFVEKTGTSCVSWRKGTENWKDYHTLK